MEEAPIWFGRGELAAIRDRALALAEIPGLHPMRRAALLDIANAADRLDSMEARLELEGAGSI